MSTVVPIPPSSVPKRDLRESMERVLRELETVRKNPAPDPVHDLRVAIRRCRSVGAVFQEIDPDPAWAEMRRVPEGASSRSSGTSVPLASKSSSGL